MTSPRTVTPHATAYDVIVVGARAAGAATALLLARAGLDVLVVDRSRYGADTLSTHALMRGGVVQLQRWGLLDSVIAAGTPAVRSTTFNFAHDQISVAIKPSHGVDALYAPRRTVLDPILVDAAAAIGATFRFGVRITDLTRDDDGRVSGVVGRDDHGRPVEYRARWVVGADGIHSVVARAAGAPIEHQGSGATGVVYGYWRDLATDGYEWFFVPDACAGIIPTNDGMACVFAAASPGRVGRGNDAFATVVAAASPQLASRLGAANAPAGLRSFSGLAGYMRHPSGPGWVLVGDAGYWKDPIGAHGLTDALRDAELVARAIRSAAAGEPEHEAFGRYHRTRNELSLPLFTVVDTVARMRWSEEEIPGLLLQLSVAMADEVDAVAQFDDDLALAGGSR